MNQKKSKKIIVAIVIFSLVAIYGFAPPLPVANAVDSLTNAKDTLSDSDTFVTAIHTVDFTTATSTLQNGYLQVVLPAAFGDVLVGNITCPASHTASAPNTETARCTADSDRTAGVKQITITGVANPSTEGSQLINISHYDTSSNLAERVQLRVAIIEDILMTASVNATLLFVISGTSSGAVINGVTCDNDTTATTTPFGTLVVGASTTVCQTLNVTTNADDGYIVTVEEDDELTSDSGSNINSFDNSPDNTGSTTPHAWTPPDNSLDSYHTYGHMGLTSSDADLTTFGYSDFQNSEYAGLDNTDTMVIMHHNGPADGVTQNKGYAGIAYTAEIGSLQESGDYENTLTYICTPTF